MLKALFLLCAHDHAMFVHIPTHQTEVAEEEGEHQAEGDAGDNDAMQVDRRTPAEIEADRELAEKAMLTALPGPTDLESILKVCLYLPVCVCVGAVRVAPHLEKAN